jgi:autotransporter-associated beta strand protein
MVLAALVTFAWQGTAAAASGTWTEATGDGTWSNSANWSGGTVADGADNTADFSMVDVDAVAVNTAFPGFFRNAIQLDTPRTIGSLTFGDSNVGTPGAWEVYTNTLATNILTLSGTTPTITVVPLGPFDTGAGIIDDAVIRPNLSGTSGFTKAGNGILTLDAGTTNTLTGSINVNAGTLRVNGNLDYETAVTPAMTSFVLANGSTLDSSVLARNMNVPAGATTTVRTRFTAITDFGGILGGGGSTLNLRIAGLAGAAGAGGQVDIQRDWSGYSNLNITGENVGTPANARLEINTGAPNGFNAASFATTRVNLDNANMFVRTNSNGNTVVIGELSGTSTGNLSGGNAGSAARYEIGGLNTNSTYSGIINGVGGITINKVGTGTLTLAGTFNGSGAIAAGQSLARQGGVTRVTAGTLKITGASSIPGGAGAVLTTIDILPAGTFDVSDAPSTFTTSALQKIQGGGTILGNYNHAAGRIQPGDVGAATAANEGGLSSGVVATAGTISFNGNLTLAGGDIISDLSLNPASGNDLVQVTGTTTLTSGKIVPNFLNGAPAAGLTYTVLNSTGGFSGAATNLTVDFAGRGTDPLPFVSGNNLQFTTPVGGVVTADLVWTGSTSGAWDVETTQNWTNAGSPDKFFNFDDVTFNETGTNKTVTLATVVSPTSIEVDNTTAYSFTGAGAIIGPTGLTKTGAGTLTMQLNNTFTGPASVTGSTANIGAFANGLGAGPLTLTNATVMSTVSVGNSTLDVPTGTTSTIQIDGAAGTGGTANIPTLTGGGTVNLTSTIADKFLGTFVTSGFTGTLNVSPTAPATQLGQIRIRGGQTDFSNAVVNLTGVGVSNQQGAAADTSTTVGFGELHGSATTSLVAFNGGSTPPDIVWQIGALNTNSDFAGTIVDGAGAAADASIASVTKVGTGTLTLTGANTYTGNTRVDGGVLSINQPYLADVSDVFVAASGVFDLNFAATDTIDSLYLNNLPVTPGTWGSLASTATNKSALFSGTGILQVTTLGAALGVIGDYNGDNVVDAADYTRWRDNLGGLGSTLLNRDPVNGTGVVAQADYDSWKANFGATFPGAGGGLGSAAVPEPASWLVAVIAVMLGGMFRRRS